jgi:hypothetical protein
MVDGFESDVLPQPYHMQATPTPRRALPFACALCRRAASRPARQAGRSASRQGAMPTLVSRSCPVAVVCPPRSAFFSRNSRRSMQSRSASSSSSASVAIAACGAPKPRKAPAGTRLVSTAQERATIAGRK